MSSSKTFFSSIPSSHLASILKCLVILSLGSILFVAFWVIPAATKAGILMSGSQLAFIVSCLPLCVLAGLAWKLFSAIKRDEIFSHKNAALLMQMAASSALSAFLWLVDLIIVAFLDPTNLRGLPSLAVAFVFCIILAAVASALSIFCSRAAQLKEENDLVI